MAGQERLICGSDDLAEGAAGVRFEVSLAGRREPAFVVRFEGRAYGYLNRCAHVPSELDWIEGNFFDIDGRWLICATHGAIYDPATGHCAGGPCRGGGLVRVDVIERDGGVYLVDRRAN